MCFSNSKIAIKMTTATTHLICLNEINFDLVKHYCSHGKLKNFSRILDMPFQYRTQSESEYHLLEPWIQWVTVHTGLDYKDHGIFRLGDIVERNDLEQVWEYLESCGKTVGAISPFNTDNRLNNAAFFAPDPWTQTSASGSWLLRRLSRTISLAVNENATGRMGLLDGITLILAILTYSPIAEYTKYFSLIAKIKKPGTKAMILDQLLCHVYTNLCRKTKPDFASLFLNSGAHIQHHYMFNSTGYSGGNANPDWYCESTEDPLERILEIYDHLLGEILSSKDKFIIATGLHQVPHETNTYYWRLKGHAAFLAQLGVTNYKAVIPRMSRDFLIEFHSAEECEAAVQIVENVRMCGTDIMIFSIDNRGDSLFVELVYPHDIGDADSVEIVGQNTVIHKMRDHVSFVAIKNGEHNGKGYVLSSFDLNKTDLFPLRDLRDVIVDSVV